MEAFLAAVEATAAAQYLRASRWGYAAVSGAHILGIALLVGAILPLNLRLLGFWRSIPRANLLRVLVPVAATGLVLAVFTGPLLFSVGAGICSGWLSPGEIRLRGTRTPVGARDPSRLRLDARGGERSPS